MMTELMQTKLAAWRNLMGPDVPYPGSEEDRRQTDERKARVAKYLESGRRYRKRQKERQQNASSR